MCAIYFMSFLDRTNVSLAKAQLATDLGISAARDGFGSGIFFIGYALLEVPSNLVGAPGRSATLDRAHRDHVGRPLDAR